MTEPEFRATIGTWEWNPKKNMELTAGFGTGVWFVKSDGDTLKKGSFDECYALYNGNG